MRTRTLGTLVAAALALSVAVAAPPALAGARRAKAAAKSTAEPAAKPARDSEDASKRPKEYLMWVERDGVPTLVGEGSVPPAPRVHVERSPRPASARRAQTDLERWAAEWGPDADPVPQQVGPPPDRVWEAAGVPSSYVYDAPGYGYYPPFAAYPFFPGYYHKGYGRAAYGRTGYGHNGYGRGSYCPPPRRPVTYSAGYRYGAGPRLRGAYGPRVAAPGRGGYGRLSSIRRR